MQVLYTLSTVEETPTPTRLQTQLDQQLEQTRDLFIYLTWFLTQVLRYTETYAHKKASKHLPTEADLNINTKLAGNELLWQILEKEDFKKVLAELSNARRF